MTAIEQIEGDPSPPICRFPKWRQRMQRFEKPIVEMRGIDKHYGGVHAVRSVDLDIYSGEVHALVGDNAAGKSTLIKILVRGSCKDAGTISFDGRRRDQQPRDAKQLGIETVYQDLALADNLDVPSNVFLGREMTRRGLLRFMLDNREMEKRSRSLLGRLKINIPNIRQRVRSMSGGQRQSIAIARCVCFNARVVILDEPTAALGVEETRKVYALDPRDARSRPRRSADQPQSQSCVRELRPDHGSEDRPAGRNAPRCRDHAG